jgi:hypothetical protein
VAFREASADETRRPPPPVPTDPGPPQIIRPPVSATGLAALADDTRRAWNPLDPQSAGYGRPDLCEKMWRHVDVMFAKAGLVEPKLPTASEQAALDHASAFPPQSPHIVALLAERTKLAAALSPSARADAAARLADEMDKREGPGAHRKLLDEVRNSLPFGERGSVDIVAGDRPALQLMQAEARYAAARELTRPGPAAPTVAPSNLPDATRDALRSFDAASWLRHWGHPEPVTPASLASFVNRKR